VPDEVVRDAARSRAGLTRVVRHARCHRMARGRARVLLHCAGMRRKAWRHTSHHLQSGRLSTEWISTCDPPRYRMRGWTTGDGASNRRMAVRRARRPVARSRGREEASSSHKGGRRASDRGCGGIVGSGSSGVGASWLSDESLVARGCATPTGKGNGANGKSRLLRRRSDNSKQSDARDTDLRPCSKGRRRWADVWAETDRPLATRGRCGLWS
jgi:hypothetical protein